MERTEPARLTVITAKKPKILTKSFHLAHEGNLVKTPGGPLVEGIAEQKTTKGLDDLATLILGLGPDQALCYGVSGYDKARIVTADKLAAEKAKSNGGGAIIARDRNHFSWPDGPGIMLNDFDGFKAESPGEIRETLLNLCADLAAAPMYITASASSGIYHGETCLRGLNGWRCLILVKNAADIQRAADALFKISWLAGLGFIHISESGAQLIRGPLDGCVNQPERLDFMAGAKCTAPLEQRRPEPVLYNRDAKPFDTRLIKSLTPAELLEYERLVAEAKAKTAQAAKEQRARWIENRISEKIKENPDATDDEKQKIKDTYRHAADHRILHADFVLHLLNGESVSRNGESVSVAEILADREKFHLSYIKDPLEPNGENSRARLHLLNAGRPYIWSFYQSARFTLSQTRKKLEIRAGARVDRVENLLRTARDDGGLFLRGGEVVAVNEAGEITPLNTDALQYRCDGLVMFQKYDRRAKAYYPADCPRGDAQGLAIAAKMNDGLPNLRGIISHPTLDPKTGRIITRDGYDTGTGLLLRLDATDWPDISEKPDEKEILKAAESIFKPFAAFPFGAALDLGVFFAALLTALIRVLLETAPLFMITAPTPGTGKTLLARCLARLIGLNFPAVFPGGGADETEIRKRLLSIFRSGARLVVMDNLTGTLISDSLCAAVTSPTYNDRILGASEIISAPTNTLFMATGNNIRPGGDLCRRTITARLDAETEKPWQRTFDFNVLEYIDQHRPEMVTAALTILKGAYESGFKVADGLGSFEDWNATARNAVCYLQELSFPVDDPALSIEKSLDEDPETGKLSALLAAWFDVFGDAPKSTATCINTANEYDNLNFDTNGGMMRDHPALFDACDEIAGERGNINIRRLSRWIERQRDRIIDGLAFQLSDLKTGGAKHWIVKINF